MGRFNRTVYSKKTIKSDFKAEISALYRRHGNGILEENLM